ncbi:CheR family methyltransferase [Neobacillus sp. LXY-1]|uniref:CheR family methyltransferase n=1 Tax=Neobacillus sp. LXY-1 TaxID=3379133 RepID=UPI003EE3552D
MIDHDLMKLSQLIYHYCGLNYNGRLLSLKDKLAKRVGELGLSYGDYSSYLAKFPAEWDLLVEILTINETYFYREEHQLNECCHTVLPMLKEMKGNRPIRIWSAACSTGEEPYTLAMLIQETRKFPQGSVEIIATDINKKVLQKAETGWYHKGSFAFRRIPDLFMKKYFQEQNNGFKIDDSIQKMVTFRHLNLLETSRSSFLSDIDVVFCRNVLIYFDQDTTKKVISHLHRKLSPGGFLFLGHAESITELGLGFQKVDSHKTFYYRKDTDTK